MKDTIIEAVKKETKYISSDAEKSILDVLKKELSNEEGDLLILRNNLEDLKDDLKETLKKAADLIYEIEGIISDKVPF